MKPFFALWEKALSYLEEDMPVFQFNVWIKELKPIHQDNNTYFFEVSSPLHKNLLTEKYAGDIIKAISTAYEEVNATPCEEINLDFITNQEASNLQIQEIKPELEKEFLGSPLNKNYTFDTFVVGESNKFANAAALAVAQSPGNAYNPLFLYGGVGLGKTHLMHAVGNHILKENPKAKIVYVTSETFMNELIRMIQLTNNNANVDLREQFRNKYRNIDALLVDDIQFLAGKDVTQDEFFHTFNDLFELKKQIVISSDRPPKEIDKIEERMRSRFEWGLIADVKAPDFETRVAILQKKSEMLREQNLEILPVKDEVFHYIAEQPNTNIRTLEGALQRVFMYTELHKQTTDIKYITQDIAKRALEDFFPTAKAITPKSIIDIVCKYYGIKVEDIKSQKKNRELSFPRQVAMYIIRCKTSLPLEKIAELFGKKDHTTPIHAEKQIKKKLAEDEEFALVLEDIMRKVKG